MHTEAERVRWTLRALRGAPWYGAAASGAAGALGCVALGGTLPGAVQVALFATAAVAVAGAPSRTAHNGLSGIARAWAMRHPWRYATAPAAGAGVGAVVLCGMTGLSAVPAVAGTAVVLLCGLLGSATARRRVPDPIAARPVPARGLRVGPARVEPVRPPAAPAADQAPSTEYPAADRLPVLART